MKRNKITRLQGLGLTRKQIHQYTGISERTQRRINAGKRSNKRTKKKLESINIVQFKNRRKLQKDEFSRLSVFGYKETYIKDKRFESQTFVINEQIEEFDLSEWIEIFRNELILPVKNFIFAKITVSNPEINLIQSYSTKNIQMKKNKNWFNEIINEIYELISIIFAYNENESGYYNFEFIERITFNVWNFR